MADKTIFDHIREDHERQRTLMKLIAKTSGDSEGRQELYPKFAAELRAHAAAEEQVFYSELLAANLTRDKAGHSVHEHKVMEDLLDELDDMDFSSPHWLPKFRELAEENEHHMTEEEQEVFQIAGRVLTDAQKHEMVAKMAALKAEHLKD